MSNPIDKFSTVFHNYFLRIENSFGKYSSLQLIAGTSFSIVAFQIFLNSYKQGWLNPSREQIGNLLLRIPYIQEQYQKDLAKERVKFSQKNIERWAPFKINIPHSNVENETDKIDPQLITTIPENGWSDDQILNLIDHYKKIISSLVKYHQFSGTIYSKNLLNESNNLRNVENKLNAYSGKTELEILGQRLEFLFAEVFKASYLWNSLHSNEFPCGNVIDYQNVQMVSQMYGKNVSDVLGFITSGGTETNMTAMRIYRNWARTERSHCKLESVIIAPKSVHASILKAAETYDMTVVLIETDENDRFDINTLKKTVNKYGSRVVALVGSAPTYAKGHMDPIEEMAKIAKDKGIGMHVDACLGGFIINHLSQYNTQFFEMPGVTSVSTDNHKNGWASKGSSTLMTHTLGKNRLAKYSFYAYPDSSTGVYGTPKDAGSQSCVNSFTAFVAMLAIGQSNYRNIALKIHETAKEMGQIIEKFPGKLRLLGKPEVNVVALKIDEAFGLEKGAAYALAFEMKQRNFVFNELQDDCIHFCVTGRFIDEANVLAKFEEALKESIIAVKIRNEELKTTGKKFPGDAGMYCALDEAMSPQPSKMNLIDFFQKYFFGKQGARDTIREYFLSANNPYIK